jgi:hypothetical protein
MTKKIKESRGNFPKNMSTKDKLAYLEQCKAEWLFATNGAYYPKRVMEKIIKRILEK